MSSPTEAPRPRTMLVAVQLSRRHRRRTAVVAEGAPAPVRDARLRGRRRGHAEAQGPRRGHAARRGQAGRSWPPGPAARASFPRARPPRRRRPRTTKRTAGPRRCRPAPRRTEIRAPPSSSSTTSCSPRQLRNIERATSAAQVLDRTGVIIEIFHRHASSRPARLQVEIARLTYVAPRLRETGGGERQRGGVGQRGAGESSWSSIAARSATASPSSRRSWPPSKTSRGRAGPGVRTRCGSRWSGTPTRASRR